MIPNFMKELLLWPQASRRRRIQKDVEGLLPLLGPHSQPNINALWMITRNLELQALSVKYFGYELAKQLAAALPERTNIAPPKFIGLRSKPSTQADLESDWVAYWCQQLKIPVLFHRKIWELAYVLQAIYENGHMRPGAKGLGFGCGVEVLPSYLASREVTVTATDLPPQDARTKGWVDSKQHSSTLEQLYKPEFLAREKFDKNVELRFLDMNVIPADLRGFDFCWSICSLEHLGTIQKGLDFIVNSLDTLRPGGLAVHTTEFNFLNDRETIDNWGTVLFQRQHFLQLDELLRKAGHKVAKLDFNVGAKPLDKFIDIPPFTHQLCELVQNNWTDQPHIKVAVDGFAATCFGLVITKKH